MEAIDAEKALRECSDLIADSVADANVGPLNTFLWSKGIYTDYVRDAIEAKATAHEKMNEMLKALHKKVKLDARVFDTFLKALRRYEFDRLAQKLQSARDKLAKARVKKPSEHTSKSGGTGKAGRRRRNHPSTGKRSSRKGVKDPRAEESSSDDDDESTQQMAESSDEDDSDDSVQQEEYSSDDDENAEQPSESSDEEDDGRDCQRFSKQVRKRPQGTRQGGKKKVKLDSPEFDRRTHSAKTRKNKDQSGAKSSGNKSKQKARGKAIVPSVPLVHTQYNYGPASSVQQMSPNYGPAGSMQQMPPDLYGQPASHPLQGQVPTQQSSFLSSPPGQLYSYGQPLNNPTPPAPVSQAQRLPSPVSGCRPKELHAAKCRALRRLSNRLRNAMNCDLVNLKFELCANSLISQHTRDTGNAADVVAGIQSGLQADDGVWEKFNTVLEDSGQDAMCRQLKHQLRVEMGEEAARL